NTAAIADYVYDNSVITDRKRLEEFFSQKRSVADILNDPVVEVVNTISIREYNQNLSKIEDESGISLSSQRTAYTKAMYEMQNEMGLSVYPDANSTMRLTFGEVGGIVPRDA